MRGWFLAIVLLLSAAAVLPMSAQQPTPTAAEKSDKGDSKAKAPEKVSRDESSTLIYYTLSAIGVVVVMLVICMPARRN